MKYINCTNKKIVLTDGTVYEMSGYITKIEKTYREFGNKLKKVTYGKISNIPEERDGIMYIVPEEIMLSSGRKDLISYDDVIKENSECIIISEFITA